MTRKDEGLTEVVGFIFVLTVFIMLTVMWVMVAVPILALNDETAHAASVRLEVADLKNDLDTMCISTTLGIKRENTITLAPAGDQTQITILPNTNTPMTFGSLNISVGDAVTIDADTCYPVNITYASSYQYAPNVVYSIEGGTMYSDGKLTLGQLYNSSSSYEYVIAVDSQTKDQTAGGNEAATIQYTLLNVLDDTDNKKRYYVFSMRLVYRAEGVQ